jgi:hypothetical protein
MATRRLVVALATLLAVLVALRVVARERVRRVALAMPLAVASALALVDTGVALTPGELSWHLRSWVMVVAGAALFAIAYATDRATAREAAASGAPEEDFAAWLYPASAVVLHIGLAGAWDQLGAARPAILGVGVLLLAAALALGRTWLLLFGALDVLWFFGWLAFDVFRDTLSFPFVLAALGGAVIALTVLLQRRYPALLRRAGAARARGELPRLPGGWLAALAPLVVALGLLTVQAPRARERAEALAREEWRNRRATRAAPERRPEPPPPGETPRSRD